MVFWKALNRKYNCVTLITILVLAGLYFDTLPDFYKKFTRTTVENRIHEECDIPIVNPLSKKALEVIQNEADTHNPPACRTHSNVKFIADHQSNLTRLEPNSDYWSTAVCCYVGFDSEGNWDSCTIIPSDVTTTNIPDKYTFINVRCKRNGLIDIDYQDQFQFLRLNPEIQSKQAQLARKYSAEGQQQPNIILYGIDSLSHANFQRSFPKSRQFIMAELNGIEFTGRNKIAPDTIENLLGVLVGETGCGWSDCTLIWDRFAEKGYTTLKAEDELANTRHLYPRLAKHSPRKGARVTHYDTLPYFLKMVELNKKKADYKINFGCFDHQWSQRIVQERILNTAKAFAEVGQGQPYFHFAWTGTATHELVGFAKYLDDPLFNLLTSLHSGNLLNNTILILFSDHGVSYNAYARTVQGSIEARMPALLFVFPPWFLLKYSAAVEFMKANADRLTTPYDMHATLLDLLDLTSLTNPSIQDRLRQGGRPSWNQGMSLFLPVPRNRSCASANIPDQWCICCSKNTVDVARDHRSVIRVVNFAMEFLQVKLASFPQCADLTLSAVENARKVQPCTFTAIKDETYLVQFRTRPSEAIFEAQVAVDEATDKLRLIGTVNRLNRYGGQSACLDSLGTDKLVRWMLSVCFCKNYDSAATAR